MENLEFSEEEIQDQLAVLGYTNIPRHRLQEVKRDLDTLIQSLTSPEKNESRATRTPPAITKEKVGHISPESFYLHHSDDDTDKRKTARCNSYAQHSVAPKLQLPHGTPSRLLVEPDSDDTLMSRDSFSCGPGTGDGRVFRRKVLRKLQGGRLVCDESVYSDDSGAASSLEDRLSQLHVSDRLDSELDVGEDDVEERDCETEQNSLSAFESYVRALTHSRSDGDLRPKPKSFIRPVMTQTHKKTDPVAKYFQYKQLWDLFKVPGERDHRQLRWAVKERLAHQPPQIKPHRVHAPSSFTVPTEKKRSSLRWRVRTDLANGLIPDRHPF